MVNPNLNVMFRIFALIWHIKARGRGDRDEDIWKPTHWAIRFRSCFSKGNFLPWFLTVRTFQAGQLCLEGYFMMNILAHFIVGSALAQREKSPFYSIGRRRRLDTRTKPPSHCVCGDVRGLTDAASGGGPISQCLTICQVCVWCAGGRDVADIFLDRVWGEGKNDGRGKFLNSRPHRRRRRCRNISATHWRIETFFSSDSH